MPTMQQEWRVPFVARLRLHTRMTSREALLVALRLYEQLSCLDGAEAADRVVELGIADILLIVPIADASQNAMSGGYDTVAEGFVLVGTLIGWNFLLDWASYRRKAVAKFAEPAPLLLIDRGRVLTRNLRREFLTRDELDAQMRIKGVTSVTEVKRAYMESDGKFSIVTARSLAWEAADASDSSSATMALTHAQSVSWTHGFIRSSGS
jgi:uncharacterized membrane protein YcaP (DUF421 family)